MKLTIENIAKIKFAEIEINGITVIAGENNTGKSTIGKVLYSLFNTFCNIEKKYLDEKIKIFKDQIYLFLRNLPDADTNELKRNRYGINDYRYIEHIISNLKIEKKLTMKLLDENAVNKIVSQIRNEMMHLLEEKNLSFDFASEDKLKRSLNRVAGMSIEDYALASLEKCLDEEFGYQKEFVNQKETKEQIIFNLKKVDYRFVFGNNDIPKEKNGFGIPYILNEVVYIDDPFVIDVYSGIAVNQYGLLNSIARRNMSCRHQDILLKQFYYEGNREIMNELLDKNANNKVMSKIYEAAKGTFEKFNQKEAFRKPELKEPIYLLNLSAGLKTFVIIKKLLENSIIHENCTLILDEPEIHLHPKWQLLLAEIIVLLQKELSAHILLTTHSPYFLNAIEVYAAKYKVAHMCKYYLSKVDESGILATVEDVTTNINKIYELLAEPFQTLDATATEEDEER